MIPREMAVEWFAKAMCQVAGFHPIDPFDGSSNWWMFNSEAEKLVDDIRARFPPPPAPADIQSASQAPAESATPDANTGLAGDAVRSVATD